MSAKILKPIGAALGIILVAVFMILLTPNKLEAQQSLPPSGGTCYIESFECIDVWPDGPTHRYICHQHGGSIFIPCECGSSTSC